MDLFPLLAKESSLRTYLEKIFDIEFSVNGQGGEKKSDYD